MHNTYGETLDRFKLAVIELEAEAVASYKCNNEIIH